VRIMAHRALHWIGFVVVVATAAIGGAQCPPPSWVPGDQLGAGMDSWVHATAVFNGHLVIGGYFTTAGGVTLNGIGRWTGSSWQPFGTGMDGPVWALETYNGELIASGAFSTAGGTPANNIARWTGSGWQPLGTGTDLGVIDLHVHGGQLIAAGDFTTAGGVAANRIAAWNGSSWQPLGSGLDSTGYSLLTFNGQLVVGGGFQSVVSAWNGSSWTPLGTGFVGIVYTLAVHNGELFAAGPYVIPFPWGGGQWIRLWRLTSGVWQPLWVDQGYEIAVLHDFEGQLILGGQFGGPAGASIPANIASWDGSSVQPLGAGLDGGVRTLTVHDGALIAGGMFAASGPIACTNIARWTRPLPLLSVTQPGGPGTGTLVSDAAMVPGREYFNIISFDLCPGGPGSGPVGGLCFTNISVLFAQVQVPVGTPPFHFVASATAIAFGPYGLPPGLAFDALCADVTGGILGCVSPVSRHVVQ
jgi:hypothetical protein